MVAHACFIVEYILKPNAVHEIQFRAELGRIESFVDYKDPCHDKQMNPIGLIMT